MAVGRRRVGKLRKKESEVGEARRKKQLLSASQVSVEGARSAREDDLTVPRRALEEVTTMFPGLQRYIRRCWPDFERGTGQTEQPWCAAPVDLVRSVMALLRRERIYAGQRLSVMPEHEASILGGLMQWSERRQILMLDRTVWNDTEELQRMPMPSKDVLMNIPGGAVYIATPGLRMMGEAVAGVMVHVDDVVVERVRKEPELQMVCMMSGKGKGEGLGGLMGEMGARKLAGYTPVVMNMPLSEDMEAGYSEFVTQKMSNLEKLAPGLSGMLAHADEMRRSMMNMPGLPEDLKAELSALMAAKGGVMGEHREGVLKLARLVSHVVRMATSGEYDVRLAAGVDNPAGEIRVIGKRTEAGMRVGPDLAGEAHRQQALVWRTSGKSIDISSVIAGSRSLAEAAEATFLMGSANMKVALPQAEMASMDVQRNVSAMFPSLSVRVLSPVAFKAAAPEVVSGDGLLEALDEENTQWRLTLRATSAEALYVSASEVTRMLGKYVLARVAVDPQVKPDERIPCLMPVLGLMWSMPPMRARYGQDILKLAEDHGKVAAQLNELFTAYVVASMAGLDPRVVSYGILAVEKENPEFSGLVMGYMGDLRYVVAFEEALARFLSVKAGLTREGWQERDEAGRCKAIAGATVDLMRYQDEVATEGLGGAGGGIKWVPEEVLRRLSKAVAVEKGLSEELKNYAKQLYDGMEEFFARQAGQGEMATMLQVWHLRNGRLTPGMTYCQAMHGGEEGEFIAKSLAERDCVFVQRTSEAWTGMPKEDGKRDECFAVRFIFKGGESRGIYKILSRRPPRFEKSGLKEI